ncbi:MAG TPA: hypothetical protein P5346_02485 [Spirochaetota bacterium]|nr:hypothetical protein [Spirochaetota bacterium]HSA13584.1 hypothetical protein [Spirochaetota bacterium]
MKQKYAFRSLPIVSDTSGKTRNISYDLGKACAHSMELSLRDIMLCRSWIQSIIISLMAVILAFVLIYGALVIGFKADMGAGTVAFRVFTVCMALSFIVLSLAMGIPSAVRRHKLDLVIRERGQENWKIVDEKDWEHFCRIITLAEERRKKMLKEAINKPDGK